MASIDAFDTLHSFIGTAWPDAAPMSCPLAWDNEAFTPPAPFDAQDRPQCWGRVLVDASLWDQDSIGAGDPAEELWEEVGTLALTVFSPAGAGSRPNRDLLTAFAGMVRGQRLGGLEFRGCRFDPARAKDESGAWWGMTIIIDWKRGA
ncbi:hypothetical protein J2848_005617 [Azospirillum lipoferum]|uniref:DUF3168 domain-containing protein n=1 Tax=Azospirillum lipoferum TaxID=193 RepID=A0A5A9GF32_AZOLI|nr:MULTISPECIES: hypothetical protein [Azospirillum]KAA0593021.1 hypothetical protein FZ942_26225 [Azospirillum lipoferum]MCP1613916.1 hypothetical protein [Azospirillum lipoferum]MDW5537689.1 hypothetical protein [Azospirillum sp. NL1]